MTLGLEVASVADVDRVLDLRERVAGWLAAEGIDLWQSPLDRGRLALWIARGAVLVHRDGDGIAGTVTMLDRDPEVWGVDDTPAVYVHLLMVDRSRADERLGACILEQVEAMAREDGAHVVRLDAGSDLERLQQWYADRGYDVVATRTLTDGGDSFAVTLRQKPLGTGSQ